MKRIAFAVTIVTMLSLGMAVPVLAAVPDNDTYAGRTVIDSLPFNESVDTRDATTDADDVEANDPNLCGAPAIEASVWYEVVAPADGFLLADVFASDFPAGLIVVTGSPGSFTFVTCGAGAVIFPVTGGIAYSLLAFDFEGGGNNGGVLDITVDDIPPPPTVELTVDPAASFNAKTGVATVRGTITCTGGEGFNKLSVQLSQSIGRFKFFGEGGTEFDCNGTTQSWAVEVASPSGKFAGGKATAVAQAFACNIAGCSDDIAERIVTLKK